MGPNHDEPSPPPPPFSAPGQALKADAPVLEAELDIERLLQGEAEE
jgi:hypothetical protein